MLYWILPTPPEAHLDCLGLPWIALDCLGLPWIALDPPDATRSSSSSIWDPCAHHGARFPQALMELDLGLGCIRRLSLGYGHYYGVVPLPRTAPWLLVGR